MLNIIINFDILTRLTLQSLTIHHINLFLITVYLSCKYSFIKVISIIKIKYD